MTTRPNRPNAMPVNPLTELDQKIIRLNRIALSAVAFVQDEIEVLNQRVDQGGINAIKIFAGNQYPHIVCTAPDTADVPSDNEPSFNSAPKGTMLIKSAHQWTLLDPAPDNGRVLTSDSSTPTGVRWA